MKCTQNLTNAGRARRLLHCARIGREGECPVGFDYYEYSEEALKTQFGIEIIPIRLNNVFQRIRQANPQKVNTIFKTLEKRSSGFKTLDPGLVLGTLASYLVLCKIVTNNSMSGLGIQC